MRPLNKQFLRENLLGLSLTLIGLMCLAMILSTTAARNPSLEAITERAASNPQPLML